MQLLKIFENKKYLFLQDCIIVNFETRFLVQELIIFSRFIVLPLLEIFENCSIQKQWKS